MEKFNKRMDREFEKQWEGVCVEYSSFTRFISLGKCYEGVTMLHNMPLPYNLIKVTVEKVLYGDAAVLVLTSEVTIVVEALHTLLPGLDISLDLYHTLCIYLH